MKETFPSLFFAIMKYRFSFILLLTASVILLAGCDRSERSARKVGYKYANAMANYQVEEAAQYATEETRNTTLVMAGHILQQLDENYIKSDTPAKVKIVKFSHIDDTTAVMEFHKTTPIKDLNFPLLLRKRNGQWMVHDTIPVRQAPEETDSPVENETTDE